MADKKVVIYSTETWPWCHRAKEYLSRKSVAFTDYNVGEDRDKAQEMIEKSGQMGVPVITIDDKVIIGFNQKAIDEALALENKPQPEAKWSHGGGVLLAKIDRVVLKY